MENKCPHVDMSVMMHVASQPALYFKAIFPPCWFQNTGGGGEGGGGLGNTFAKAFHQGYEAILAPHWWRRSRRAPVELGLVGPSKMQRSSSSQLTF